jgi:hypothetical protein
MFFHKSHFETFKIEKFPHKNFMNRASWEEKLDFWKRALQQKIRPNSIDPYHLQQLLSPKIFSKNYKSLSVFFIMGRQSAAIFFKNIYQLKLGIITFLNILYHINSKSSIPMNIPLLLSSPSPYLLP